MLVLADSDYFIIKACVVGVVALATLADFVMTLIFPNKARQIAMGMMIGDAVSMALGVIMFYRFLSDHSDASGICAAVLIVLGFPSAVGGLKLYGRTG